MSAHPASSVISPTFLKEAAITMVGYLQGQQHSISAGCDLLAPTAALISVACCIVRLETYSAGAAFTACCAFRMVAGAHL